MTEKEPSEEQIKAQMDALDTIQNLLHRGTYPGEQARNVLEAQTYIKMQWDFLQKMLPEQKVAS